MSKLYTKYLKICQSLLHYIQSKKEFLIKIPTPPEAFGALTFILGLENPIHV